MISEVVCRHILLSVGLPVLDARLVVASERFANSWNGSPGMPYKIQPGVYFGTIYKGDAIPIETPPPVPIAQVKDLQQVIDMWVCDTLVANIDRTVFGNVLMLPHGKKFIFVPADQSDCFCGSDSFADGSWRERLVARPAYACVYIPDAIALSGGAKSVRVAIEKTRVALNNIGAGFGDVPREWWQASRIDPEHIERELWRRHEALPGILRLQDWGDLNYEQFDNIPNL